MCFESKIISFSGLIQIKYIDSAEITPCWHLFKEALYWKTAWWIIFKSEKSLVNAWIGSSYTLNAFIECGHLSQTRRQEDSAAAGSALALDCCWCTDWRRGTSFLAAHQWTRKADSYHQRCRKKPFSLHNLERPPLSATGSWDAVVSTAVSLHSIRFCFVAWVSSNHSLDSTWHEHVCPPLQKPLPGPTWIWSQAPPPSSVGLCGNLVWPVCWHTGESAYGVLCKV